MIASDPIRCCRHSCKPGAVHIWVSLTLDPTYGGVFLNKKSRVHSAE